MHTLKALELEIANFRYDPAVDLTTFLENLALITPGVKARVRLLQHQPPPDAAKVVLAPSPDTFISWEAVPAESTPAAETEGQAQTPTYYSWWFLTTVTAALTVALSLLLKRLEKFFFSRLVSN
jgi:hypothetical protein